MLSRKYSIYEKVLYELGCEKYPMHNLIPKLLKLPSLNVYKRQTLANALQKLKKEKLIRVGEDAVTISMGGQRYLKKRMNRLHFFDSPFSSSAPKNLLVLFDIPEDQRAEREWFRKQLQEFNYMMIQKSVWLGPSPLPKVFVDYVKSIGLKDCIKTFKLARDQQKLLKK